jgi:Phasin protein
MAQKEAHTERTEKFPLSNLVPAQFAAMGRERIQAFVKAQTEVLDQLQETNRQWFESVHSEANLASDLASKLTAVHSIPDAMSACQEWTSRRFEMMAEDGKHLLADYQKLMEMGTHLLSNGGPSSHPDAGK